MSRGHLPEARRLDFSAVADLDDYLAPQAPRRGRPPKHDLATWRVVDDWPAEPPIGPAEVDVFEIWFGDVLDELFDPQDSARAACPSRERK